MYDISNLLKDNLKIYNNDNYNTNNDNNMREKTKLYKKIEKEQLKLENLLIKKGIRKGYGGVKFGKFN